MSPRRFSSLLSIFVALVAALVLVPAGPASAVTFGSDFSDYDFLDLGTPQGVPSPLGGLTLKAGDPDTLLIGGAANSVSGAIYEVPLTRGPDGRVTGLAGPAHWFADAPYIDGGLAYFPGTETLIYTGFPDITSARSCPAARRRIVSMIPQISILHRRLDR